MEGNFQMKPTARDYILATYEESLAAKKAFIDNSILNTGTPFVSYFRE